ncbi:MAG: protein-disulfide reductase DsbD domain-containing protein [Terracidiphilus sp.]
MIRLIRIRFFAVVAFAGFAALAVHAQIVSPNAPSRTAVKTDAVEYLFPEQVSVPAGKPATVALHFRVAQGLHINSHTPSDEFLIPTVFSIPDGAGVRLAAATYPAGTVMAMAFDPKTKLSVYTGEFTIEARIVAAPGNHLVQAKLRYQACDNNQCMPPKTIPVAIDVIGK